MSAQEATIAFIFPPYRGDYEFHHHLGVGYVKSRLSEKGIDSVQYVPKNAKTSSSLVEEVLKLKPEFIGFTCYDSNYYVVKSLAHLFKKEKPEIPIIIGGPTATFSDSLVLEDCPDSDICVRGEGEETTLELIRTNTANLKSIKGISFRRNGSICRTEDRPLMRGNEKSAELDIFSSPYLKEMIPLDGQAGILTSRGCTYKCVYCNFSAMSRHTVRYHSVDRVIAELKKIDDYMSNIKKKQIINIYDDAFSLNKERAKEICRRIIDEKIDLDFFIDTRADACDIELFELMRGARVKSINFGLESAVPRVLRNIKKVYAGNNQLGYEPEKQFLNAVKQNVELAKKLGFRVSVSVITGLPTETLEDAKETMSFVNELGIDEYAQNYLNIFAGTELFETYKQYGYKISRSDTILPFRTICPYNAYSLQPLANANLYSYVRADERTYFEVLANSGINMTDHLNVLVDAVPQMSAFYSWLSNYGTIPFTLFIVNTSMTMGDLYVQTSKFVEYGAPIGKAFFAKSSLTGHEDSYLLIGFSENFRPTSFFVELPLSECGQISLSKEKRNILTMSTKKDVEKFSELVKESVSSGRVIVRQPFHACSIRDECRWATEPCPAANLRRIIIDQDGSVRVCFNGTAISNLTLDRQETRARLESLYEETLLRRGCDSCSAKSNCSKCLFPTPLTEDEYCTIRKNLPEIGCFIDLLRTTRVLSEGKLLSDAKEVNISMSLKTFMQMKSSETSKRTKMQIKPETRLVYVNEVPYVVNRKDEKVFKLNPLSSKILESIILDQDIDDLVSKLEESFKKSRNEVREKVNQALLLFVEKGFLEHQDYAIAQ